MSRRHISVHSCLSDDQIGYPTEVGALFTTVSSIRVSRVSIMVSVGIALNK